MLSGLGVGVRGVQSAIRIATGSIGVGVVVLALKASAWWITGGAALYSDALETVVNVAASSIALYALRVAVRPADHDHPFGHAKAEFLAAALDGALIIAAAASILQNAWHAWQHPAPLDMPWRGMLLNFAATLINLAWARLLLIVAKRERSPALAGDARHLLADVATSTGVLSGVVLVVTTKQLWLDPVVAALAAIYVLVSGIRLLRNSVGGLMDEALDDATLAEVGALIAAHGAGALEAHDLRTRHAGQRTFLQFHLVVPASMSVAASHEICDRIEAAFHDQMSHMIVNIHVEPEDKAKHHGVVRI